MAEAVQAEAEKKGKKGVPARFAKAPARRAQALLPAGNQASGQKQSVAGDKKQVGK